MLDSEKNDKCLKKNLSIKKYYSLVAMVSPFPFLFLVYKN